eukprot:335229-Chlamydomonas_euryale.AAC.1
MEEGLGESKGVGLCAFNVQGERKRTWSNGVLGEQKRSWSNGVPGEQKRTWSNGVLSELGVADGYEWQGMGSEMD